MHKTFTCGSWDSLEQVPRQLSLAPPALAVGDLREKHFWESRVFFVCSFSFILRGSGEYRFGGRSWPVTAPCVLTQFPGASITYGPDDDWDEIFIVYSGDLQAAFQNGGIDLPQQPLWRIRSLETVRAGFNELFRLLAKPDRARLIDSIDAQCLKIVTDSRLAPAQKLSVAEETIRGVRTAIDADLFAPWQTRDLACQAKMSVSAFRRHWLKAVGTPPQQYIIGRKMDMACQLLLSSHLTVGEIADALHFDNHLYFSRLFKKKTGQSPSAFREAVGQD